MRKLMFTRILPLVVLLGFMTTSCTKDFIVPEPVPDVVSFVDDIQPFFNAKCTNCHGNAKPNLEYPDSYDNLINGGYIDMNDPANSLLYTEINIGGSMEQYATTAERDMTLKWIEQGAQNN